MTMTVSIYSIPDIMLGSVSLYVALHHFLMFSKQLGRRHYLYFGCLCVFLAMYDFSTAGVYNSTSISQALPWFKRQMICVACVVPSLIFFTGDFLNIRINKLGYAFCGVSAAYVMALLFTHLGVRENMPAVKYIALLDYTYYEVATGPATDIFFLLTMGLLAYLYVIYIRHYRSGKKYILPILVAIGPFFVIGINDMLMSMGVYTFIYLTEYSFMAMVIGMSFGIVNQFAMLQRNIEVLNKTLEVKVHERTRQLEKAVSELERSNREFQDFAHIASHDLQEPLRKVKAFGDRLASRAGDCLDDRAKDYLGRMQNAAIRMSGLLNGLLRYARVTTKGNPFVPVDMDRVVTEVLGDLEIRISETAGKVEKGRLGTVQADPLQMRQLVQNLVGNALKYHKPDVPPAVNIASTISRDKAWFELTVRDNGIGIADEDKEKAFGIFQRLVGKGVYEGNGVGLSICKKIVERHEGSITLQGEVGVGTTFTVRLPVRVG